MAWTKEQYEALGKPSKFLVYFSYTQSMGDPSEYKIWKHTSRTKKELVCTEEGLAAANSRCAELLSELKREEARMK